MLLVSFCVSLIVLRLFFPYFAPFIFGLFIAFMLDIPVSYLEQKGWSRPFASLIFSSIVFLTLPVGAVVFLLQLWEEIDKLACFSTLFADFTSTFIHQFARVLETIPILEQHFSPETLFKLIWAIPDLFLIWTITILSAYFFCRDKKALTDYFSKQLLKLKVYQPRRIYRDTFGALWSFLQVQLFLMLVSTAVSMLFFIILELPYALLLGFLVGIFDLCPVLGPGLVYFALAVIQLWLGNTCVAIALAIGYLILFLVRQWGEPYLVGDRLGLHPLIALGGLYVGFRFWGPTGALLAPILIILIKSNLEIWTKEKFDD